MDMLACQHAHNDRAIMLMFSVFTDFLVTHVSMLTFSN